jgi:hypothetical protein
MTLATDAATSRNDFARDKNETVDTATSGRWICSSGASGHPLQKKGGTRRYSTL